MTEGAEYFTHKRRRCMGEVVWSVHVSYGALDRASKGTIRNFRYLTRAKLEELVDFESTQSNHCSGKEPYPQSCAYTIPNAPRSHPHAHDALSAHLLRSCCS